MSAFQHASTPGKDAASAHAITVVETALGYSELDRCAFSPTEIHHVDPVTFVRVEDVSGGEVRMDYPLYEYEPML